MAMSELREQTRDFLARQEDSRVRAGQVAALQICCGMDLSAELAGDLASRAAALRRLGRMVERERLKGQRRHWSYDLNRHIALKQAADLLSRSMNAELNGERSRPWKPETRPTIESGARRRRGIQIDKAVG